MRFSRIMASIDRVAIPLPLIACAALASVAIARPIPAASSAPQRTKPPIGIPGAPPRPTPTQPAIPGGTTAPPTAPPSNADLEWTGGPACGLERHPVWALRAVACMRLERSSDPVAIEILRSLSRDPDPRVRAFAVTARSLRGDPPSADTMLADPDRRVLRAALRAGLRVDAEDLAPIVLPLLNPDDRQGCLLGIELAACVDDRRLQARALEALSKVIMRLDRTGAGGNAQRLELLLGSEPGPRPGDWQKWWLKSNPRTRSVACRAPSSEHELTRATDAAFASFANALRGVVTKPIDLALCIDSTSSMFEELPDAQMLGDELGRMLDDLVPGSRVGVVGYRDRRSDFLTLVTPLDATPAAWRLGIWGLAADKGGSAPEAVLDGLFATFRELRWDAARRSAVVLIGDGPPHSGTRTGCATLAREAREQFKTTTFVVSARALEVETEVKGFTEIAEEGGGEIMRLTKTRRLAGLILGGEFGDSLEPLLTAFRARCDLLAR